MIRRQLTLLFLTFFTLLCVPSDVRAQQSLGFHSSQFHSSHGDESVTASSSYGWQIALVDGGAALLLLSAASNDSESIGLLGIGGYLVGGPIVHSAHGNAKRAVGSLALRVVLPVVGARLLISMNECDPQITDFCGEDEMVYRIIGGGIGVMAAGALDWFLLGRQKKKETTPALSLGGVRVQPTLYPSASGAQLGVMGQF